MAGRVLCFSVLASLLCLSWARKQTCLTSASTCDKCMQSGPDCGWCIDPLNNTRCNTLQRLRRAGCTGSQVYNPKTKLMILRNEPADGSPLFLQPQEMSLVLRPGVSQVFTLTITLSTDQPVKELMMETTAVPEAVNITFRSIATANPIVFEVNVIAANCPSDDDNSNQTQNKTGPWSVDIKPRGFSQSMNVQITLECQCECLNKREPNSPLCNNHGTLVCGQCLCQMPYSGQQCQTNFDSVDSGNDDYCRSAPNGLVCSGRGICVEGFCVCSQRENPDEKYFGRFCECSNFDCPYHNGRLCGGKGKCECGECICDESWTGEACSCSMNTANCMTENGMLCNARGICECGRCKCDPSYSGPTCEFCPTCQNKCQEYMGCAECRAFEAGWKKDRCEMECHNFTLTLVDTKDDLPPPVCKIISREDSCFFYFSYSSSSSGGHLTVAKDKECPRAMLFGRA